MVNVSTLMRKDIFLLSFFSSFCLAGLAGVAAFPSCMGGLPFDTAVGLMAMFGLVHTLSALETLSCLGEGRKTLSGLRQWSFGFISGACDLLLVLIFFLIYPHLRLSPAAAAMLLVMGAFGPPFVIPSLLYLCFRRRDR
jgi:hypothetical protein